MEFCDRQKLVVKAGFDKIGDKVDRAGRSCFGRFW